MLPLKLCHDFPLDGQRMIEWKLIFHQWNSGQLQMPKGWINTVSNGYMMWGPSKNLQSVKNAQVHLDLTWIQLYNVGPIWKTMVGCKHTKVNSWNQILAEWLRLHFA